MLYRQNPAAKTTTIAQNNRRTFDFPVNILTTPWVVVFSMYFLNLWVSLLHSLSLNVGFCFITSSGPAWVDRRRFPNSFGLGHATPQCGCCLWPRSSLEAIVSLTSECGCGYRSSPAHNFQSWLYLWYTCACAAHCTYVALMFKMVRLRAVCLGVEAILAISSAVSS